MTNETSIKQTKKLQLVVSLYDSMIRHFLHDVHFQNMNMRIEKLVQKVGIRIIENINHLL